MSSLPGGTVTFVFTDTDTMESRLEARINAYVETQIGRAFDGGDDGPAKSPTRHAAGGIAILLRPAVAIIAIIQLVKLVL
jgi:hypothetical protein